jgi:hypothetical protein
MTTMVIVYDIYRKCKSFSMASVDGIYCSWGWLMARMTYCILIGTTWYIITGYTNVNMKVNGNEYKDDDMLMNIQYGRATDDIYIKVADNMRQNVSVQT